MGGKKIESIVDDSESDAEKAIDVARKMVQKTRPPSFLPCSGRRGDAGGRLYEPAEHSRSDHYQEPPTIVLQKMKWTISPGGTEPQGSPPMGVYAYEEASYRKMVAIDSDFTRGHGFLDR